MAETVLFVGFRSEAIKAALNLNCKVVVVSEKEIPSKKKEQVEFILTSFSDENLDELLKKLSSVKAVVALTESSVEFAAKIREALKLKGTSVKLSHLCRDKFVMKNHCKKNKIPITDYTLIEKIDQKIPFDFPFVVKQRASSGSRDLRIIKNEKDLRKLKVGYLAESFVKGKEVSIESFIIDGKICFQNITEYYEHHAINILPYALSKDLEENILKFNKKVIESFGIENSITHLEIYLTQNGIIFGEIAIRPPGGYLMELISQSFCFNPWEALINLELGKRLELPLKPKAYSAVWILHPGAGVIQSIQGIEEIQNKFPNAHIKFLYKQGERVERRKGSGEHVGRVMLSSPTYSELIQSLNELKSTLKIEMIP